MHIRSRIILLVISLAVLSIIPYYQVINHGFVNFDDYEYVVENPHVNRGLSIEGIKWAFTAVHSCNWHPMTWLSHMLDCELYGLNPSGHHLTNLIFHVINALLLFLLLLFITGSVWKSAFVAALFAIHPLHVESVAWISERKDVLSTFFGILALWAYVYYAIRPNIKRYLAIIFFFVLGLMSKPMLITFPFVLILLDYWPLQRIQSKYPASDIDITGTKIRIFRKLPIPAIIAEKIPLFLLCVGSAIITIFAQTHWGVLKTLEAFPLKTRFINAILSYINYIKKTLWPARLGALYPYPGSFSILEALGASLLILCILLLTVKQRKRHPYFLFGILWYLGTLIPVIGFIQVGLQSMADRYTYIPLIGIFIIIAWGVPQLLKGLRYSVEIYIALMSFILISLTTLTYIQAGYWRDSIILMQHTLEVTRENYLAYNGLGTALIRQGNLQEGLSNLYKAVEIKPDYAIAHENIGITLARAGRIDEAIYHYNEALKKAPHSPVAHNSLGIALLKQGDMNEAINHFQEAIRLNPYNARAYNNLGIALMGKDRVQDAIETYRNALEISPGYAFAHNNMGIALEKQGHMDEAKLHYADAIRFQPRYLRAHYNLGLLLAKQGAFNESIQELNEALGIDPGFSDAHLALGYIHHLVGDLNSTLHEFATLRSLAPGMAGQLAILLSHSLSLS